MPIYEYLCQDCKQIFEDWQQDHKERDIPCPVCGGNAKRIISSTSFVLKGGGWYANGYSGAAESASTAKPAAAAAPTTAAATEKTPEKPAAPAPAPAATATTAS